MIPFHKPTIRELEIRQTLFFLIKDSLGDKNLLYQFNDKIKEKLHALYVDTFFSLEVTLFVGLTLLNVQEGDEVILSAFSAPVFYNAILAKKAIPLILDIEENHFTVSKEQLKTNINIQTKAIIISLPFFYSEFLWDYTEFNIPIIYDITSIFTDEDIVPQNKGEAPFMLLSRFKEEDMITTLGNGCVMALYDDDLIQKAQALFTEQDNKVSYPLSIGDIQAAIGLEQLSSLKEFARIRKTIAQDYDSVLKNNALLKGKNSPYLYYPFLIQNDEKQEIIDMFYNNGVEISGRVNAGLLKIATKDKKDFPMTQKLLDKVLYLPIYPTLQSHDVKIIKTILSRIY